MHSNSIATPVTSQHAFSQVQSRHEKRVSEAEAENCRQAPDNAHEDTPLAPRGLIVVPVPHGWSPTSVLAHPPSCGDKLPFRGAVYAARETNASLLRRARGGIVYQWACVTRRSAQHAVLMVRYPSGISPTSAEDLPPAFAWITGSHKEKKREIEAINACLLPRGLYAVKVASILAGMATHDLDELIADALETHDRCPECQRLFTPREPCTEIVDSNAWITFVGSSQRLSCVKCLGNTPAVE